MKITKIKLCWGTSLEYIEKDINAYLESFHLKGFDIVDIKITADDGNLIAIITYTIPLEEPK